MAADLVEVAKLSATSHTAHWLLYACRSTYTPEVVEIIWRRAEIVEALVDNLGAPTDAELPRVAAELPVVRPESLTPLQREMAVVVPLITPGHRHRVVAELRTLGLERLPALVDPASVVARSAVIGGACVLNTMATIGANSSLGYAVHVNRGASIGHDAVIDDYATIGPCAMLAGGVKIGRGAFLGVGVICAPGTSVGDNAVVGAGAVVVRDVPPAAVVVGNPARVVRIQEFGYGGVSVPC